MNDEFKLIGLEKISLRFNLLRRLALNDNPIQATAARELLLNKYARRAGGWYELIVIFIVPLSGLAMLLPFQYMGAFAILGIIGLFATLTGFFLLTLPIVRVINRDYESKGLRYTILNSKEIFSGLLQVQVASYLIPQVIGSLLNAFIFFQVMWIQGSLSYGFEYEWSFLLIQFGGSIVTGVSMVLLSIIVVLSIRTLWGSFTGLIVAYFLIPIFSMLIFIIRNPIGSVAIYMFLVAGLTYWAYRSVVKAVMPE